MRLCILYRTLRRYINTVLLLLLFPFPLKLFPFPLVAQNYSHSHGNPMGMGIPIPMNTSNSKSSWRERVPDFRSYNAEAAERSANNRRATTGDD